MLYSSIDEVWGIKGEINGGLKGEIKGQPLEITKKLDVNSKIPENDILGDDDYYNFADLYNKKDEVEEFTPRHRYATTKNNNFIDLKEGFKASIRGDPMKEVNRYDDCQCPHCFYHGKYDDRRNDIDRRSGPFQDDKNIIILVLTMLLAFMILILFAIMIRKQ